MSERGVTSAAGKNAYMTLRFIGRESELRLLSKHLTDAVTSRGSTVIISGEPGIGKTRLVEEFIRLAGESGVTCCRGGARHGAQTPFSVISEAYLQLSSQPLFEPQTLSSFSWVMAGEPDGRVIARSGSAGSDSGTDAFASILPAVQQFVRDSFSGGGGDSLGLVECGDTTVMVEPGRGFFIAVGFKGPEHPGMRILVHGATARIPQRPQAAFSDDWHETVEREITRIASERFIVRRDIKGIKLDEERVKVAERFISRIEGTGKPHLVVLEDLHISDDSSLAVVEHLARNILHRKVMLLCTCRLGEDSTADLTLERMRNAGTGSELPVVRLDARGARHLVDEVLPNNDFPEEFIISLASQCGGNPLFIIELLRQMASGGAISPVNGRATLVKGGFTVPASVEELIRGRLARLSGGTLAAVEYASCIGLEFTHDAAKSIGGGHDYPGAFAELVDAGIWKANETGANFCHAMYQEVVYSSISDRWKGNYHKNLGEYYESAYAGRMSEGYFELARHFSKSSEHAKAIDYCIAAAEKAEGTFAAEMAIGYYQSALASMERLGRTKGLEARRIDVLLRMGENLELVGRWDEARKAYEGATAQSERTADTRVKARARQSLGRLLWRKGEHANAMPLLEEAMRIHDAEGDKRSVGVVLGLLGDVFWSQGKYDDAMSRYRRQQRIANDMSDDAMAGHALGNVGQVMFDQGNYDGALECFVEALSLLESSGNVKGVSDMYGNIGNSHCYKGDYPRALENYNRQLELVEKMGNKAGACRVVGNIGVLHFSLLDYEKALSHYRRQLEIAEQLGERYTMNIALGNIGEVHLEMGEYREALAFYERKLVMARALDDKLNTCVAEGDIGRILEKTGKNAEAAVHLDAAISIAREGKINYFLCGYLHYRAELHLKLGDIVNASAMNIESLQIAEKAQRSDIVFEARVLKARILAETDRGVAVKELEMMLKACQGEAERAAVAYDLFRITGSAKMGRDALSIYRTLAGKVPNARYRDRAAELVVSGLAPKD